MSADQEDEIDRLRWALAQIADVTQRQQLPITAEVHALATEALYGPRDSDTRPKDGDKGTLGSTRE